MQNLDSFDSLVETFKKLRGPKGCPWDKEQTHESLKPFAIEEVYELLDAIDSKDDEEFKSELGDVLLQVMLHAQIAADRGAFTITDVILTLNEKMHRRHPHVFGDVDVASSDEVIKNWDQIKAEEKAKASSKENRTASGTNSDNPFSGIPIGLPALQRSSKIGKKSIRYNFDWPEVSQVLEKVDEELAELREAIFENHPKEDVELELGDCLFSLAQVGRKLKIDPEQALRATNKKFETRFCKMRDLVEADGKDFSRMELDDLDAYWVKAKMALRG